MDVHGVGRRDGVSGPHRGLSPRTARRCHHGHRATDPPVPIRQLDEQPGEARPGIGRRLLPAAGWTALVAALTAVVGFLLARRFYYGNDDLLQFSGGAATTVGRGTTLFAQRLQDFAPQPGAAHVLVYQWDRSLAGALA